MNNTINKRMVNPFIMIMLFLVMLFSFYTPTHAMEVYEIDGQLYDQDGNYVDAEAYYMEQENLMMYEYYEYGVPITIDTYLDNEFLGSITKSDSYGWPLQPGDEVRNFNDFYAGKDADGNYFKAQENMLEDLFVEYYSLPITDNIRYELVYAGPDYLFDADYYYLQESLFKSSLGAYDDSLFIMKDVEIVDGEEWISGSVDTCPGIIVGENENHVVIHFQTREIYPTIMPNEPPQGFDVFYNLYIDGVLTKQTFLFFDEAFTIPTKETVILFVEQFFPGYEDYSYSHVNREYPIEMTSENNKLEIYLVSDGSTPEKDPTPTPPGKDPNPDKPSKEPNVDKNIVRTIVLLAIPLAGIGIIFLLIPPKKRKERLYGIYISLEDATYIDKNDEEVIAKFSQELNQMLYHDKDGNVLDVVSNEEMLEKFNNEEITYEEYVEYITTKEYTTLIDTSYKMQVVTDEGIIDEVALTQENLDSVLNNYRELKKSITIVCIYKKEEVSKFTYNF